MTTPRRSLWLFTTFTVAWMALWPLVSSAHALMSAEPIELCHQAGMQVAPGEMPMKQGLPSEGKQHCPLCVMAFLGGFESPPDPLPATHFVLSVHRSVYEAPLHASSRLPIPQSRAPPVSPAQS